MIYNNVSRRNLNINTEKIDVKLIYNLFKEVELPPHIIKHVELVAKISKKIAKVLLNENIDLNLDLVIIGALLHDIGRSKTHSIKHAIIGAEILKEKGFNQNIINIVERHIGGGIDTLEAKELNLPIKDYTPISIEEKIVSASDNLTFGHKKITLKERLDYFYSKNLIKGAKKIELLHKELSLLAKTDLDFLIYGL